jgi:hypothetical protein
MKIITLSAVLILSCVCNYGQNLIGFNEKEIMKYMKENRHDMNYNNVINSKFSYLKYSDSSENETLLFFLTPDSVCRSVRIICDETMKSIKIKELDSMFVKKGEYQWIEMMEGNWSCIISIEPEK